MKCTGTRRKELTGHAESFGEWVAGLGQYLEGQWKTGTPETANVTIQLGQLLDLCLSWQDQRAQVVAMARQVEAGRDTASRNCGIPFVGVRVGQSATVEEGRVYMLRVLPACHPVMEENARVFERRADMGC